MFRNNLLAAAVLSITIFFTAPRPAAADNPDRGDFASFGVQWMPPRNTSYAWPTYSGHVAAYYFSGNSDKSTANVRVEVTPIKQRSLTDVANDLVKHADAKILSDLGQIGGEAAIKLVAPTSASGYHTQRFYLTTHGPLIYTFSAFTSGNADQAGNAASAALEDLTASVRFAQPDNPRDHATDELLPAFRFQGEALLRLPSAMRCVGQPTREGGSFAIHDYAADFNPFVLIVKVVSAPPVLHDAGAQSTVIAALKKTLNCPEDPVLISGNNEPQLLLSPPLHGSTEKDGVVSRQTVQIALADISGGRRIQFIYWIPDQGPTNEQAYLQLALHMIDAIRITPPPQSSVNANAGR